MAVTRGQSHEPRHRTEPVVVISPIRQTEIVLDGNVHEIRKLAAYPELTNPAQAFILDKGHGDIVAIRILAAGRWNFTPDTRGIILCEDAEAVRVLAGNPKIPFTTQLDIIDYNDLEAIRILAANPAIVHSIVQQIMKGEDHQAKDILKANLSTEEAAKRGARPAGE